ncbi:MAG: DeoR family transcriptional regulator [Candidatus Sungbacteria bacterium]|uniref:DeoR family transcriptional regulator n=1 Tax=Candidatus Sungiibacteriota bacterium TaxID=2750080 RepID=A0A931SBN9_9BACT|nr:DeoR family transcriptional regulator [Candidatus Sungbacteria bacterium]
MNDSRKLPLALRRQVYTCALSIYGAFEPLPERGVLVQDIESATNRLLTKTAAYRIADVRDKILKDIIQELRGIKALLGIVRDIPILERHPAGQLFKEAAELESAFDNALGAYQRERDEKEAPPGPSSTPATENFKRRSEETAYPKNSEGLAEGSSGDEKDIKDIARDAKQNTEETNWAIPQLAAEDSLNKNISARDAVSLRQEAITEVLKRREKISIGELGRLFSGRVGLKTLQRDLQELIDKGVVVRNGERRWALYSIHQQAP